MKVSLKFCCFALLLFLVGCEAKNDVDIKASAENNLSVSGVIAEPLDNLVYKNKRFSFGIKQFPKDFEIEYLNDDAGLIFKKAVVPPPSGNPKDPSFNYTVEIYVTSSENLEDFGGVSDLVGKKYAGYTFEFADYGDFSGYYVNEGVMLNAVSHFFTFGKGNKFIYEVYLKVPSKYYSAQKDVFEKLVKDIVFF